MRRSELPMTGLALSDWASAGLETTTVSCAGTDNAAAPMARINNNLGGQGFIYTLNASTMDKRRQNQFNGSCRPAAGMELAQAAVNHPLTAIAGLLPLIFAFAQPLIDFETRLFCIRNGQRFEFMRCAESGNDLPHRLFAVRTFGHRRRGQCTVQRKCSVADLALAFA